jgi:OOP family OmpA-OmpF porin
VTRRRTRAEADFDCWILNGRVDMQKAAAQQCRRSLDVSLAQLERAVNISSQPAPMPAPVATTTTTTTTTATTMAAPAAATTGANYQVYFDFDSWSLTAEDLTQISQAVAAAKAGAQSRVTIVGHTDTSGSAEYNLKLSERRAGVVKDTMVQMGARPEAIQVSGVGKSDLAVQTADGVKEARNRRAVITLLP